MLRVTIELVPFGMEAMAKTIVEMCIANVGKGSSTDNVGDYEVAGYTVGTDNRIEEFAYKVESFARDGGALALLKEVLNSEPLDFDAVEHALDLINKTRLLAGQDLTGESDTM